MEDSYIKSLIRKRYVLELICPKCGQKRMGETVNLRKYAFMCYKCGKSTSIRNAKGDNCKYKVLYERA